LLDDVLNPSALPGNESGLRTGTDASNPSQYKNLQTAGIDMSMIFPSVAPYSTSFFTPATGTLSNTVFSFVIGDDAEKALRSIFHRRYNQIWDRLFNQAPCSGSSLNCGRDKVGRCVKELVILEYRSIAQEFIAEAKLLPLPNTLKFGPNQNVAPVELAAAKLFDFHFAADPIPDCQSLSTPNIDPTLCIQGAQSTKLKPQRNLQDTSQVPSGTITTATNVVKSLGLGNLNAYLSKLGQPEIHPYSALNDNLLIDLHGSAAEYAFNFGILEDILAQDGRSDSANSTCFENIQFPGFPSQTILLSQFLGNFIPAAKTRTLCTLLQDMLGGTFGFDATTSLHAHMFRGDAPTLNCL